MGPEQKKNTKVKIENEKNKEVEITERERILLAQYRNLCDESKMTIDILVQRLLGQEKGRE